MEPRCDARNLGQRAARVRRRTAPRATNPTPTTVIVAGSGAATAPTVGELVKVPIGVDVVSASMPLSPNAALSAVTALDVSVSGILERPLEPSVNSPMLPCEAPLIEISASTNSFPRVDQVVLGIHGRGGIGAGYPKATAVMLDQVAC